MEYLGIGQFLVVDVDGRGPGGDDIQPGQQIETVEPGGDMDDIGPRGRPVGNINLNYSDRSSANTNARLSLKTSTIWERTATDPSSVYHPKISYESLKGLSLNEQTISLYKTINKNSINLGDIRLDLIDKGFQMGYTKGHYDKISETRIETPHYKINIYKFNKLTSQFETRGSYSKQTFPATEEHIKRAVEIINTPNLGTKF